MRKACAPPTTKSKKAHEPPMLAALLAVPWFLETYKTGPGKALAGACLMTANGPGRAFLADFGSLERPRSAFRDL
jgi:hypothetical protein